MCLFGQVWSGREGFAVDLRIKKHPEMTRNEPKSGPKSDPKVTLKGTQKCAKSGPKSGTRPGPGRERRVAK